MGADDRPHNLAAYLHGPGPARHGGRGRGRRHRRRLQQALSQTRSSTEFEEIRRLQLQDGSRVTLNTETAQYRWADSATYVEMIVRGFY